MSFQDEIRNLRLRSVDDEIMIVREGHFVGSLPRGGGSHLNVMTANGVKAFTLHPFCAREDGVLCQGFAVIDDECEVAPRWSDVPRPFMKWAVGGETLPPMDAAT